MRKKYRNKIIILAIILLVNIITINRYVQNQKEDLYEPFVKLYLHNQETVVGMNLEEYIKGTVAAEMPASFEIEALKAQAVCARTYAIKKIMTNSTYPGGADLSDDINSCQAFISLENFASENPAREDLLERISKAVESTRGEILLYDSKPIDALYCSTCGGRTESSEAVWGGKIPYLSSVKCEDCEQSVHYQDDIMIRNDVIKQIVNDKGKSLQIKILSRTPGGRPKKLSINQHEIDASILRKTLNLPSTWMEFQSSGSSTIIHTHGYGHGVGLCQWGANGMAQRGKDYHQILEKYYQGVSFYKLTY